MSNGIVVSAHSFGGRLRHDLEEYLMEPRACVRPLKIARRCEGSYWGKSLTCVKLREETSVCRDAAASSTIHSQHPSVQILSSSVSDRWPHTDPRSQA
jgi:hypothetical protein